jgi:hypothetical protein
LRRILLERRAPGNAGVVYEDVQRVDSLLERASNLVDPVGLGEVGNDEVARAALPKLLAGSLSVPACER